MSFYPKPHLYEWVPHIYPWTSIIRIDWLPGKMSQLMQWYLYRGRYMSMQWMESFCIVINLTIESILCTQPSSSRIFWGTIWSACRAVPVKHLWGGMHDSSRGKIHTIWCPEKISSQNSIPPVLNSYYFPIQMFTYSLMFTSAPQILVDQDTTSSGGKWPLIIFLQGGGCCSTFSEGWDHSNLLWRRGHTLSALQEVQESVGAL